MDRTEMEKMFYDGILPREMCYPTKKEYKQTLKLLNVLEGEFREQMTPEQIRMLDDYKEYQVVINTIEQEEHFVQGLSLGIRLTSEAFTNRKGKSDT
jgi:c-di-GMP-related signal transduction protein